MYVIWDHYYRQAQEAAGPADQRVLAQCTAEVPYLMRLGEWEQASRACERAINHDGSPATAGRLLPYDVQIVRAAEGTDLYPGALFVYTNLVRTLDEGRGQVGLTRLLKQADHRRPGRILRTRRHRPARPGAHPARPRRASARPPSRRHHAWPPCPAGHFAGLRERLQDTTGVDIEALLAELDRVPVTAGPEPGALSFAPGAQDPPPGDSVTDALTWASHQPPPAELTDVDGHRQHWQPIMAMAATAASGDLEAQQAMRQLLDDYRGMGWSKLADALGAFLTDPLAFTPSSGLPPAERTILGYVCEAFRAR